MTRRKSPTCVTSGLAANAVRASHHAKRCDRRYREERNGQIVRIGNLRFSDGNQTEVGYVLGIDGEVLQADIRMPAGAMLGMKDKPDRASGGGTDPKDTKASNHYFQDMLGTQPHRYIPSGKRRNGTDYSTEESARVLAEAYANTDMEKVTFTRYPKGLPCGSPKVADSFLGMRKTTCAGGGDESWEDTLSAMIDRDLWFEALQELKDSDRDVLDAAIEAGSLADIGVSGHQRTKERQGKRRLIAANDNLVAALKNLRPNCRFCNLVRSIVKGFNRYAVARTVPCARRRTLGHVAVGCNR